MSAAAAAPLAAHAAAEPGSRRDASWPAIAPVTRGGEGDGAHALADRAQQHLAAGDRGEHQVAGVAGLQRDRPAVAAAAQAEGDGGDGDEPDDGGAVVDDVGELARRRRLVGDEVAQPHHGETAEEGGEVDAIGDLEPLELAEPAGTPGAPHLAKRQRRRRHRPATLTGFRLRKRSLLGELRPSRPAGSPVSGSLELARPSILGGDVGGGDAGVHGAARPRGGRPGRSSSTVGRLLRSAARELMRVVDDAALWLAFIVAAVATAGSLYFSEVANYVPCRLCWFQRIAMYPLAVILLIAAIGVIGRSAGTRSRSPPSAPASRSTTTSSSGTRGSRATSAIRPIRARSCGSASSASSRSRSWRCAASPRSSLCSHRAARRELDGRPDRLEA